MLPRGFPNNLPAHDQPHHLVGPFENLVHAHVAQHALDWMIAQVTVAAVQLQAAVHRVEAHIRGEPLRLRGKPRCAGRALVTALAA